MKKLFSIGIALALLVTFVVPVSVGAQTITAPPPAGDDCCEWTVPDCPPMPDRTTKTLAGAVMWTMLSTTAVMGKAVCVTTGQMVCNLGGWSDELGVISVEVTAAAMDGVAGLLEYVFESFLGMGDLGTSLGDLLRGIAEVLAGAAE